MKWWDQRVDLRQLVLAYLVYNKTVELKQLTRDISGIVDRLRGHGCIIDLDDDSIRPLLDYFKYRQYVDLDATTVTLRKTARRAFDMDFVKQRMFDTESPSTSVIIAALDEVANGGN